VRRRCVVCWEAPIDPSAHPEWCPKCLHAWMNVHARMTVSAFSARRARRFERARHLVKSGKVSFPEPSANELSEIRAFEYELSEEARERARAKGRK